MDSVETKIKNYMDATTDFWSIPTKSLFHNLISLLVSQRIRFAKSREIRKQLYGLNDNFSEYDSSKLSMVSRDQYRDLGLTDNLISAIFEVISLEQANNLNLNTISDLKQVGPWTVKALRILNYNSDDDFLFEDYWIRQRVSELFGFKTVITSAVCADLVNHWKNKSNMSRFFWRIKDTGISKIKSDRLLDRNDFV